jgi:hypothetical protein
MKDFVLIFDYYKGDLPKFNPNKHIFVFSSHKHHDHFDLKIFDFVNDYPIITYVLSKDIRMSESYMERNQISDVARKNIIYIGKNDTTILPIHSELLNDSSDNQEILSSDKNINIETLTSTDAGVAFIISYKDNVIYHAGDLNWWTWPGETEEEYEDMTNCFKNEIDKLKGKQINVAFVPLDPRQEDRYWWGFDYFMRTTNTKVSFPMHFWMDYTVIDRLLHLEQANLYKDNVMLINEEGQKFSMSI